MQKTGVVGHTFTVANLHTSLPYSCIPRCPALINSSENKMQTNSKGQDKEQEQSKAYSIFLVFGFLKTNLQTKNHKGKNKNESK